MGQRNSVKPCYPEEENDHENEGGDTKKKATKAIMYHNIFKPEGQRSVTASKDTKKKSRGRINKRFELKKAYNRHRPSPDLSIRKQGVTTKDLQLKAGVKATKVAPEFSGSQFITQGAAGSWVPKHKTTKSNDFVETARAKLILKSESKSSWFVQAQESGATPSTSVNDRKAIIINAGKSELGFWARKRVMHSVDSRELRKPVRTRAASTPKYNPGRDTAQKMLKGFKTLKLAVRFKNAEKEFSVPNSYDYDVDSTETIFCSPYTTVGKFWDTRTEKVLAVKQIHNANKYIKEIVNEVLILQYLNGIDRKYEYFPELLDVWHDEGKDKVYLALEFVQYNLDQVLTNMRRRRIRIERKRLKHFMWKMLFSLDILHRANILHRDIKPQNILVLEDLMGIRLIDYGSACYLQQKDHSLRQDCYTYGHIPIEVAAGNCYRYKADVFALGCIWWQMLHGGNRMIKHQANLINRQQQLSDNLRQLVQIFGRHEDTYEWILDTKMRQLAITTPKKNEKPFSGLTDMTAVDVLTGMLKLNPAERWDLVRVKNHPYFAMYKRAEPPMKVSIPFSRPVVESKQDLWDILDVAFKEFQRKNNRIVIKTDHGINLPSRFHQFTI